MINIGDKLISMDVVEKQFVCNLEKCKGACCWEGDYGAPLTKEEEVIIKEYLDGFIDTLTQEGQEKIRKDGISKEYSEKKFVGTQLLENGACAFLTFENGIAQCGIEKAHLLGKIPLKKPISCHLYPIRIAEDPNTGIHLINYDRWSICSDACSLGAKLEVAVYEFAKDALIRKYGAEFYEQLDETVRYLKNE